MPISPEFVSSRPTSCPQRRTGGATRVPAPQGGFSLVELMMALALLAIVASLLLGSTSLQLKSSLAEKDRLFAFSKAQALLSEVQSHVDRGSAGDAGDVDSLDDGIVNKDTLTITVDARGKLVAPDHELSGNVRKGSQWLWSRRISVQPLPGMDNRNVRYVTVRIFRRDGTGVAREAANLSAIVNSPAAAFPTTQVFDLYLIAIESIPGWWVFMDSIKPFVGSTITDLETRNPGLEVRTHWITKASFGRNPTYRPRINEAVDSLQPIPDVYFYPGRMPAGSASTHYYVPSSIRARISQDGSERNGYDPDANPHPYAMSDWFNHAMRYPEELALWEARVRAVEQREQEIETALLEGDEPPEPLEDMSKEPTLRLLLEDLCTNPQKYRNALIVNLHGELLPMPALRNYSDPAKDPQLAPELRVVTHSERIRTRRGTSPTNTDPARFRVHAYNTNVAPGQQFVPAIALEVMGLDLTNPATPAPDLMTGVRLQNLRGGIPVNGDTAYYPFANAKVDGDVTLQPGEMSYRADFVNEGGGRLPFTRILLRNTPCVAPLVNGRGLANDARSLLYGMAYVPGPCSPRRDFSYDLYAAPVGSRPKNTARWTLEVPPSVFASQRFVNTQGAYNDPQGDVLVSVRTRIWTGPDAARSGTMWPPEARNAPENLTTTHTWWCDSPQDVPFTERSQFQGDPRHCPYMDLMRASQSGDPDHPAPVPDFADGYNWYFDALNNTNDARPDHPGLSTARLANGWRGVVTCDVPRFMGLLRKGVVDSNCVYTTLTGFSYFYLGLGNDIGYDAANGYPNSIPLDQTPFGAPGTSGFGNNITGSRTLVRRNTSGNTYWWSMPWLGELYPDAAASVWYGADAEGNPRGNLDAGSATSAFRHAAAQTVYSGSVRTAYGTRMTNSQQRLADEGCTSFFNTGTATSTFHHQYAAGTGSVTGAGTQVASNYNFNMPTTAPISRPFGIATNASGTVGNEFSLTPYSNARYSTQLLATYFNHPNGNVGSGLVRLTAPGGTGSAFVTVNGIDRTVESGSTFIARYSILTLIHSYFEAGRTGLANRIQQPARVEILHPTDISELVDPDQIPITFETSWKRWDGLPYTTGSSVTESESQLEYLVTYSADGGATWRHVLDDSPARPGERPANLNLLVQDAGTGRETWSWMVPSVQFPQGSYYLRVDCFRRGSSLHLSYHKTKLFIQR
ncbi:MAG: hypothetical protein RIT25_1532 [Planctomycetota bacterium]